MSENPLAPDAIRYLDDVSSDEYALSLRYLTDFAGVDVNKIYTFDDLSARASTVGHDLRTVVLAQGVVEQEEFNSPREGSIKENTAVFRRQVGDHTIDLMSTASEVVVKAYKGTPQDPRELFSVIIPVKGDLNTFSNINPFQAGAMMNARDMRPDTRGNYFPLQIPGSTAFNRGYVRVLQDGVKDVLSVVSKPQPLASAFTPSQ